MTPRDRKELERLMAEAIWLDRYPDDPPRGEDDTKWLSIQGHARAALEAAEAAGCVVVPREATDDMIYWGGREVTPGSIWDAMLAASPFRETGDG